MLQVPNRTTWENYFKQSTLTNCGVELYVYATSGQAGWKKFADEQVVYSFSLKRVNCYVCETLPSDTLEVELDWANTQEKTHLYRGARVYIKYKVCGTQTIGWATQYRIKSIDIDRKEKNAKMVLEEYGTIYNAISSNQITGGSTVPTAGQTRWTHAEYLQLCAIKQGKALYYDYGAYAYKSFSPSNVNGNYDEINIIEDYSFSYDDENKKNVVIYGFVRQSSSPVILYEQNAEVYSRTYSYTWFYNSPVLISSVTFDQTTTGVSFISRNDRVRITFETQSYDDYLMQVYGFRIGLAEVEDGIKSYIQTYAFENTEAQKTNVQTIFRNYYSNDRFIEFDCRIDPTFEPLDIIAMTIDNVNYKLALEEVTINFNGGFTGHIKARIIA